MLNGHAVSKGPMSTPRGPVFIAWPARSDPYVPTLDQVKDRVREDVIRYAATN